MVFVNRVSFMQISDMIPGMLTELEGLGVFWDPSGGFRGQSTLRKFLGSKEHLDRLKVDFNVTKRNIFQDYNKQS